MAAHKVWIIQGNMNYEGFVILGVCATKSRAKIELKRLETELRREGRSYDSYSFEAYEVTP